MEMTGNHPRMEVGFNNFPLQGTEEKKGKTQGREAGYWKLMKY